MTIQHKTFQNKNMEPDSPTERQKSIVKNKLPNR